MTGRPRQGLANRTWRSVNERARQIGQRAGLPARADSAAAELPDPQTVRILVTVGTELPFDRLVSAVDFWAADRGRSSEVFAQIGASTDPPARIRWARFVDGAAFHEYFCTADLIVAHAGMGTILSALQYQRPLIVMPRRADLGEHRNDHQLATATRLSEQGRVNVAIDENDLTRRLDDAVVDPKAPIGAHASKGLIDAIAAAIVSSEDRSRRR